MHEDGVVASLLQVLAKSVKVIFGIGRPDKVVFHHRRDAGKDGRQHLKASPAVRHAVESKALGEERIEEGGELGTAVVAVVPNHFLSKVFHDDDHQIARNGVEAQAVAFDETIGSQVGMNRGEVALVFSLSFFQFGFVCGDKAKRRVKQDGRVLRVGVVHGRLRIDGVGLESSSGGNNRKQEHDNQADGLPKLPMRLFFLFGGLELGVSCHDADDHYKKDKDNQQVPIVEKDLSGHAKRHLVGLAQQLDEIYGEVFPKEMETNDVQEIQEDGNGVGDEINDVDDALKSLFVDNARRKAIEQDVQQVDAENDGKVEPHPAEI